MIIINFFNDLHHYCRYCCKLQPYLVLYIQILYIYLYISIYNIPLKLFAVNVNICIYMLFFLISNISESKSNSFVRLT